jgi:hypothetical protein
VPDRSDAAGPLRRLLLALVLVGALGLAVELLLLEHFESVWQWTPLVLLAAVLGVGTVLAARPTRRVVRLFQALMALCVAAGVVGVYLHYRGNTEFELEREPTRHGLALFWEAIRGATPSTAPSSTSGVHCHADSKCSSSSSSTASPSAPTSTSASRRRRSGPAASLLSGTSGGAPLTCGTPRGRDEWASVRRCIFPSL